MEMNRRSFLAGLTALVGGVAIEQAIPLWRVWSFPSSIVVPKTYHSYIIGKDAYIQASIDEFVKKLSYRAAVSIDKVISEEWPPYEVNIFSHGV